MKQEVKRTALIFVLIQTVAILIMHQTSQKFCYISSNFVKKLQKASKFVCIIFVQYCIFCRFLGARLNWLCFIMSACSVVMIVISYLFSDSCGECIQERY